MSKYKDFNSINHKIFKLWETVEQNKSQIDNKIKKIVIKLNPINFNKKITKIEVLNGEVICEPGEGGGLGG